MSNPTVSVVIPVCNGEAFLAEAVASACDQQYTPLEVIVADDGSTDRSAEIAESFAGVTVLRLAHGGVSRARNAAIEASSGEFLAFLDADDRWRPGKLAAQVALATEHPEAGLFLCRQVYRFENGVPKWFRGRTDGSAVVGYEPSCWLVRRETFEAVGEFEAGRELGEDTQWLAKAWDSGVRYAVDEGVFVERRIHDCNASGRVPERLVFDILRESVRRKRKRKEADNA